MSSKNLGFNKTGIPPHATSQLVDLKLDKASSELKKYLNGERKTRPTKKMLEVLEDNGVISKSGAGYSKIGGKVSRINKAKKWTTFVKDDIVKDGIDLGSYGYDAYNKATNPYGHAMAKAITGGKVSRMNKAKKCTSFVKDDIVKDGIDLGSYGYDAYNKATNPLGHAMTKAITGGAAKKPSAWISFVKSYTKRIICHTKKH